MRPEGTVEYNSLSWVKKQLDTVLGDAQSALSEYVENTDDTASLEQCIDYLGLVYGTLQMVEVYGAAMLAEEMESTSRALLDGKVEKPDDAFDVLMRAMLQLPDYLEGLQAGNKDAPIVLMPLMNDLRAARKEKLLSESVLFLPDINAVEVEAYELETAGIEAGRLAAEAKRLRTHYQLGLLDVLRNNKEAAGLRRMLAVISSLEKVTANKSVRQFWIVIGSMLESLMDAGIDNSISVKMLLGAVDRQIKHLIDVGEEEFTQDYSQDLLKNILYYVGRSASEGGRVTAVKQAYKLDELLPEEADVAGIGASMSGFNAELFDTVSQGIREDLAGVKDTLEIFMHSSDKDAQALQPLLEQLEKIADTYGMLGLGAVRQKVVEQREAIERIISGETEASEQHVMDIASALLNAESDLDNYIAEKSGLADTDFGGEDRVVPASEYRKVLSTVVEQALNNFTEAKDAILSYAAGIGGQDQLEVIEQRLEEVRGASMMLPMDRVEQLINQLKKYVQVAFKLFERKPEMEEQDRIADVVTAIEYYLEAVAEGRPGVDMGLQTGEQAAAVLMDIVEQYDGQQPAISVVDTVDADAAIEPAPPQPEVQAEEADVEPERAPETVAKEPGATAEAEEAPAVEAATTAAVDAVPEGQEEYEILGEDADDEIVEIFIEEGVEVLEALAEHLPRWKANPDDEESLTVVRRSFHTLKGSGRLIGAMLIGEFSWKMENMLNRVIEKKIEATPELFNLLDEAMAVLPQLVEQLKGNREPIPNIYNFMSAAEALSEGRKPEPVVTAPAAEEPLTSDAISVDEAIEPVASEPAAEQATEQDVVPPDNVTALFGETDSESTTEAEISLDEILEEPAVDQPVDLAVEEEIVFESPAEEDITLDIADVSDADAEVTALAESAEFEPAEEVLELGDIEAADSEEISLEMPATDDVGELDEIEISGDELDVVSLEELMPESEPAAEDMVQLEPKAEAETGPESVEIVQAQTPASDDELEISISALEDDSYGADEVENIAVDVQPAPTSEPEAAESQLDMDPMLFQIYYDESCTHIKTINDMLAMHDSGEQKLDAGKDIIRAFHTLFGSARTAGIEPIADISGAAEKYVKAREESESSLVPDDAVAIIREVVQVIDSMLEQIKQGHVPKPEKDLADRVNRLVQGELQSQLQQSSQGEAPVSRVAETAEAPQAAADEEVPYSYGDVDNDLIDIFLEEAEELLEDCESSLSKLEQDVDDSESVHALQRHMHTLKGGARMASLKPVGDLTHVLESMVIAVDEQKIEADKPFFEVVHESLDTLNTMLESVKKRDPLMTAGQLVSKIESITRGEIPEKRAIERFDIEMEELAAPTGDEAPELHVVKPEEPPKPVAEAPRPDRSTLDRATPKRRASDESEDRPHWGERATDVNYKDSQEQVRVRADLLNNLVNYAGEVNIHHARMGKQITDIGFNLKELNQTVIRLREQLRKLEIETEIQIRSSYAKDEDFDENFDPLEMDQYSTLQQLTRSLAETANDVESIKDFLADIVSESETLLMQESRISTDLQEGLMRTRMVRFGGMSTRLRRIVRQTARELGKEVHVDIVGEENEVDRTVLDRMVAPLEHMLRNAVAHGIESPQERATRGKSDAGNIRIAVGRQGPEIIVKVSDDGKGIDTDAIRGKAIKQGLLEKDSPLTDHDVLQFILKSGFSTASEVTQISGRGVGLDVVDSEIKQLGGLLEIDTEPGKGTTFKIRLPLTLAINQALLVSAGDDIYAIPLASIEGVVRITGVELQSFYDSGDLHYEFNGVNFELKHLGKLLTGSQPDYSTQGQLFPVLLAKVGDQHFALHVDDLLGRREIVVKPVGLQIGTVRGIAGATILADGRVVLILEMSALVVGESLFKQIRSEEEVEVPKAEEEPTIMVVDDSITIRKVTTRILERNGMKVMSASDGVDATNQLQEAIPDLMLLDIEMPRMDGFELASYMRNDDRLRQIPIIMITSRTGAKHKERAMEIGVDEYLGKPYQEEELMKNINALLKVNQ